MNRIEMKFLYFFMSAVTANIWIFILSMLIVSELNGGAGAWSYIVELLGAGLFGAFAMIAWSEANKL